MCCARELRVVCACFSMAGEHASKMLEFLKSVDSDKPDNAERNNDWFAPVAKKLLDSSLFLRGLVGLYLVFFSRSGFVLPYQLADSSEKMLIVNENSPKLGGGYDSFLKRAFRKAQSQYGEVTQVVRSVVILALVVIVRSFAVHGRECQRS